MTAVADIQGADLDMQSAARFKNCLDAVSAQEPVTLAQLNAAIQGMKTKDDVIVAAQGNINLASPGSTLDGHTFATNDRFLAPAQTTATESGIYIWNGASTPATRSLDADTSAELTNALVTVLTGTSAGALYWQTVIAPTVGTTNLAWSNLNATVVQATTSVAGKVTLATQTEVNTGTDTSKVVTPATLAGSTEVARRYATTIGDGSATEFTITHNLASSDIHAPTCFVISSGANVRPGWKKIDSNTMQLDFASAPASSAIRVVVDA